MSRYIIEPGTHLAVTFETDSPKTFFGAPKLGQLLCVWRTRLGQTAGVVAAGCGISRAYLSRIETGHIRGAVGDDKLHTLSVFFGADVESLRLVAGTRPPTARDLMQAEPSGDLGARFREVVLHQELRPTGLADSDVRFVSEALQRIWLEFALRLAQAMQEPSEDLECLFSDLQAFFPESKAHVIGRVR